MPKGMVPTGLGYKVDAINAADFKTARNLMPTTVQKAVIEGVPMSVISSVTKNLTGFIEHELIHLSAMVNVDQRLNIQRHQLPVIAQELYNNFKSESIEDISVCFRRGAMGLYGEIYKLDGSVLTIWMRAYLEEKYQVIESNLMEEKENFYQVKKTEVPLNPERNLLSLLKTVIGDYKPKDYSNAKDNAYQRYKLERELQTKLDRASSEYYAAKGGYKNILVYEDNNGITVYAENEKDAEEIYNIATEN